MGIQMDKIVEIIAETWTVTQQMAPYLLFGFLMAGILSVFVSPALVEEHLGRRGLRQTIKAALLGVPLPLCSCSVVPISASLYRHGAGKGATLSFLASTPQTGVDSIAVTWSLLGPVFVIFRVIAAFISGILAGCGVELMTPHEDNSSSAQEEDCCCCEDKKSSGRITRIARYGFITLPTDIGRAMLFGMLLSGLISSIIPESFFADKLGSGFISMVVMMLIGIPIYTCSSGSVPIAFGLIRAGLSPGAALVFLVTGPATNAATIATITKMLGKRAAIIYLTCICATALGAGLVLNLIMSESVISSVSDACKHTPSQGIFPAIMAIVLIAILVPSLLPRKKCH